MKSDLPKVLHPVAGLTMLERVIAVLRDVGVEKSCVVLSEDRAGFESFFERHADLNVAIQKNRQGTGDAVAATAWSFAGVKPASFAAGEALCGAPLTERHVLIMAGDVPAVRPATLRAFIEDVRAKGAAIGVLGMRVPDPKGYGRLLLDGAELKGIVEEKDADAATKKIDVCNTGIFFVQTSVLFELVAKLTPSNAQREYYLTDIVAHARSIGHTAVAYVSDQWQDFAGINDRAQLAAVEGWLVQRRVQELMAAGVTLHLPESQYVEPEVEVGPDTEVGPGCRLYGATRIGRGCRIGAGVTLRDTIVGDRADIGDGAVVGPVSVSAGEFVPALSARTR